MLTPNKFLLVQWYIDDGDNWHDFDTQFSFLTDKDLDDIKALMKREHIKRWVKNPELVTEDNWKPGDASLVEYRGLQVYTMKVVEAWGWKRESEPE